MDYDYKKLGLSEAELFSEVNHSDLESEKITAPRYSYWSSVFRVFFRKKSNIIILSLLGVVILFAYVYPTLVPYDQFANLTRPETQHLMPGAAMKVLGMAIMLYTSIITISTFLEKPQIAPTITPIVILIAAQINAREIEIREPNQMASKVELPAPPVPKIQ